MINERVIFIQQALNTLELSAVLTPAIKFGILKNKSRMLPTLKEYEEINNRLTQQGKELNGYSDELAAFDEVYKNEMNNLVNTFANSHPDWISWKNAPSSFVPFEIDLDEFMKCANYNTMIVFECHDIFKEHPVNEVS